ncbi:MAG: 16S rRNA (cytosine(1402)-N(4))-methyltransferase RsmH [Firmicutes bacterium]|nr:16S rRNA (cytosine(1402)-N(4))-methyltransferase RsmH [Bacillota bacterium]
MDFNHVSVMPREVIECLNPGRGGVFVDGTLGGGGHSKLILDALPPNGRLIGIDRDENAIAAATSFLPDNAFTAVRGNFHHMPEILQDLNIPAVDGILLDLGVSSHQLDTPERGFSYRFDGPLDMRMDNRSRLTAFDIVNTYTEKNLADLFFSYGEERHSRRISRAICTARTNAPIKTTLELANIVEQASPKQRYGMPHPAMRTFMAIRIAVNDELSPLGGVLQNIISCLAPAGRVVVITFHSLEDRIVKTTFQKVASPCECPRDIPYCVCGKKAGLRIITKKPLLPSQEELDMNKRAHSAKLRVAERI